MSDKKIVIGRLGDAFGVKGWLHLISFAEPTDQIFRYKDWCLQQKSVYIPLDVQSHQLHGDHFVVQIKNCTDRDQALLLKHKDIFIERTELPALPLNEYYWSDLVGLQVVDTSGKLLGVVDHLLETGANDVLAVKGAKLNYIPWLPSVVLKIDSEKKTIMVDWELLT